MAAKISTALTAALVERNRNLAFRCDVLRNGIPIVTGLRVTGGSLTVSSSQSPRRSVNLTAVDDGGDLVPGDPSAALSVYGNEVAVYQGLYIDQGGPTPIWAPELVPMCVCRMDEVAASTSGGAVTISVSGPDRSARVADDDFKDYFQIAAGTDVGTAIKSIVSPALPATQLYSFTPISAVIAAQLFAPGDDRWDKASGLAAEVGCVLAFDPTGVLTLQPVTDPGSTKPAWSFARGEASVMTGITNSQTRAGAANVVVVTAQGSGLTTPLVAVAQDSNPASPTYVSGSFGEVVKSLSTSTLTTLTDVQAYANSQLLLYKGITQQVSLNSAMLPHLDAFDVINVEDENVKVSGKYVIDQLSIPLGTSGGMTLTTRGVLV